MRAIDILKGKAKSSEIGSVTGDSIAFTPYLTTACFAKTDGSFYFHSTDILTGEDISQDSFCLANHLDLYPETIVIR